MSRVQKFPAAARVRSVLLSVALFVTGQGYAQDGTWSTKAPMPTGRQRLMAAVAGGKLYTIGGIKPMQVSPNIYYATVESYDPATDSWSTKQPMPAACADGTAGAIDGIIYVVGCSSSMLAYDPKSDTWTTKAPIPTPRVNLAVAAVDGVLYAIGGRHNWRFDFATFNTVEAYDPKTDTWTRKAAMPTARAFAGAGVIDGRIYVAGGSKQISPTGATIRFKTLELYDPNSNTWTTKSPMPMYGGSPAGVIGGKLYLLGSTSSSPFVFPIQAYDLIQAYDSNTDSWTNLNGIPTNRVLAAGGVLDDSLYIVGGGGYPLDVNEAFTPNRPPVANAGPNQTVECAGRSGAVVTLNGAASSDPDGDPLTFTWKDEQGNVAGTAVIVNVTVPLGSHPFTLTVDDGQGHTASASVTITVRDTTPPTLSVLLTPNVLWPADHKLVPVTASLQMNDVCDANPHYVLVSVTSNEPDNGLGDGDTPDDIQGAALNTDDRSFLLRAERSAKGTGRAYTATYRATDASGNGRTASAQVSVPLNKRK